MYAENTCGCINALLEFIYNEIKREETSQGDYHSLGESFEGDKELSIREVCKQLGKSEGFLRHIETGRRDFPRKMVLETILEVYGVTYKMFRHKVTAVKEAESKLGSKDKMELVYKMIKGITYG